MKFRTSKAAIALFLLFASACKNSSDPSPSASVKPEVVTTLAGSGSGGYLDATGTAAYFNQPRATAADAQGNVYVSDFSNASIRKITPAGVVTTLAGGGPYNTGFADGTGAAAHFSNPIGIAVDASGNVYVADFGNNRIRKITPAGVVTTVAGSNTAGSTNGDVSIATFNGPNGVAVDKLGNLYVAEESNLVRKITKAGVVSTLAGSGSIGSANGTGTAASFHQPYGITVDGSGTVYLADAENALIRKITAAGVVTTLAGSGTSGFVNGTGTAASFSDPAGVAVDEQGNVYVADLANSCIRKITAAGVVTTFAGGITNGSTNGTGTAASFDAPFGLCVRGSYIYLADTGNQLIRKISK